MPVITFASSKGGAGKTTSAIILATTLARTKRVVLIDADPARRLMSWAGKAPLPGRLTVRASMGETHIHSEIDEALDQADFVILDLEGAATRLNVYAMAESDLVIIPMGDEQQDADAAAETLKNVDILQTRYLQRSIRSSILFTRTQEKSAKSDPAKVLNAQVRKEASSFLIELQQLPAFSSLHNYGGTLHDLNSSQITDLAKAIGNAEAFTEEVLELLRVLNQKVRKKTVQMSLQIDEETYKCFRDLCKQERRTSGEMLTVMMDKYIELRQGRADVAP